MTICERIGPGFLTSVEFLHKKVGWNAEVTHDPKHVEESSCFLGLHSKTMRNKQRYCGQLQNHVRIANFRGESREITIPSKSSYFIMVL